MNLIKKQSGVSSNHDFTYEEVMEVKAFQDVLSSIEDKYGTDALKEIVENLGDKNPDSYNVFLRNQSVAKQTGVSVYWEVECTA